MNPGAGGGEQNYVMQSIRISKQNKTNIVRLNVLFLKITVLNHKESLLEFYVHHSWKFPILPRMLMPTLNLCYHNSLCLIQYWHNLEILCKDFMPFNSSYAYTLILFFLRFCFFKFIYLFWEGKRENTSRGETERKGKTDLK